MLLKVADNPLLAEALGDTPETTIPVHRLLDGSCRAYVRGGLPPTGVAIVQDDFCPTEPYAFGGDAHAICHLLRGVRGWECVNASRGLAQSLVELLRSATGAEILLAEDVYHVLRQPAPVERFRHPSVLSLGPRDQSLLEAAPFELQPSGFGSIDQTLREGSVACAVIEGRVVAVAHTTACTGRHADIGVATLQEWRGRGLATAAAALVARCVQVREMTPVWSCGDQNSPSLRVAAKLRFEEVSRRMYVVPQPSGQK